MKFDANVEDALATVLKGHWQSRLFLKDSEPTTSEIPEAWISIERKLYERFPYRSLPNRLLAGQFAEVVSTRTSTRVFDISAPVPMETISAVLYTTLRDIDRGSYVSRPYPSAGARYATEVYLIANRITELPPALYHFDPTACRLCTLFDDQQSIATANKCFTETTAANPAGVLVFSAVLPRICVKYGARGYRFALLEAGAACALTEIALEINDLATVWIGGFADDRLASALGFSMEAELELPLVALAFGYRDKLDSQGHAQNPSPPH